MSPNTNTTHQLTKAKDLCHLRVAVDNRLVLYLTRSVSIAQCAESLLHVAISWADAGYHQCVAISTQRVCAQIHKKSSELMLMRCATASV